MIADPDNKDVLVEDENDVQIEVEHDEAKTRTAADAGSPEKGIEDLKRQLADAKSQVASEQAARQAAEQRATQGRDVAIKNRNDAFAAYEQAANSAVTASEAQLKEARSAFIDAANANNPEQMADAQIKIAAATNAYTQAKTYQGRVADAKKDAETRQATDGQQDQNQVPTRSQQWIAAHPQFNTDNAFNKRAIAASLLAQANNIRVDSDEYFDFVEKELGLKAKDEVEAKQPAKVTTSTAAPASRSSAANGTERTGPTKVRLSAAELEAASISGQTPVQYAKNKLALQNEGRLPRN